MTIELLDILLDGFSQKNCITTDKCIGHLPNLSFFEQMRILEPFPDAETLPCPVCQRNNLIVRHHLTTDNKPVYYVKCGQCGKQIIEPERLRRWKICREPFVRQLEQSLDIKGYRQELIPNHTWILGKYYDKEVILTSNAHFSNYREFQNVMSRHSQAVVLVFHHYIRDAMTNIIDNEIVSFDEITRMGNQGQIEFDLSAFGETQQNQSTDFQFVKKGAWFIRFFGRETILTDELVGLRYLYHLIQYPNQPAEIREFLAEVTGQEQVRAAGRGEAKMDIRERSECIRRLQELASERKQAEADSDLASLERIEKEYQQIEMQIHRERDYREHSQKMGDQIEGLKRNVAKRISLAVKKIGENDSRLAEHFKKSLKYGNNLVYQPDQNFPWRFA